MNVYYLYGYTIAQIDFISTFKFHFHSFLGSSYILRLKGKEKKILVQEVEVITKDGSTWVWGEDSSAPEGCYVARGMQGTSPGFACQRMRWRDDWFPLALNVLLVFSTNHWMEWYFEVENTGLPYLFIYPLYSKRACSNLQ